MYCIYRARKGSISINVHELADEGEEDHQVLESYFQELVLPLSKIPEKKEGDDGDDGDNEEYEDDLGDGKDIEEGELGVDGEEEMEPGSEKHLLLKKQFQQRQRSSKSNHRRSFQTRERR
jgi:hypothetical protein